MKNPLSVEICRDRQKLIELFSGSAFFVVIGTVFLVLPSDSIISVIIMRAIGLTNVLFFGLGLIVFGKQLIDKGPAVIIDEEGITEKGGAIPAGFIPWEDITTMFRLEAPSHEILMIRVKNPSSYISRHTSFLSRKAAELNYRMYGTPVCINAGSLQCNFEELKFLMLQKIDNRNLLNTDPDPHFELVALQGTIVNLQMKRSQFRTYDLYPLVSQAQFAYTSPSQAISCPLFVRSMLSQADFSALLTDLGAYQSVSLCYFVDNPTCLADAIAGFVDEVLRQREYGLCQRGRHNRRKNNGHCF